MQSCNVVDVFHQWSIITCVWERGKERKKEQSTTCSKQRAWERKKQLQLDQSKGEGREWDGNQERSNGQRERQTNKQKRGMAEIRRRLEFIFTLCTCPGTSSPLSHHITYVYTSTFLK